MIVISLGAGVQSSTLYRMSATGALPRADVAIFADTQAEPRAVYEHLDILERDHGSVIPIRRVTAGNLGQDVLSALVPEPRTYGTGRVGGAPFFVRKLHDEGRGGMLWRECTKDYKLAPIRKAVRDELCARGLKAEPGIVLQYIGISVDEAQRMKDSGVEFVRNVYPLIDLDMTRHDCLRWLQGHGYPIPPKSACVFCPYTSDARFRALRDSSPGEWAGLLEYDAALRHGYLPAAQGLAYVHRSLRPLADVDFSTAEDRGQQALDLFGEECEGMCGV